MAKKIKKNYVIKHEPSGLFLNFIPECEACGVELGSAMIFDDIDWAKGSIENEYLEFIESSVKGVLDIEDANIEDFGIYEVTVTLGNKVK